MRKRLILLVAMSTLAWVVGVGCAEKKIDTAKVRAAFPTLTGEAKDYLEKGLTAIDQSNYGAAVKPLEFLTFKVKLDKNQRLLLEDTIAKARAKAAKQK